MRIQLPELPLTKLALLGPIDFDDAYQAFLNGVMIGEFGDFRGSKPVDYQSQPQIFLLPQPASADPGKQAAATFVLTFRRPAGRSRLNSTTGADLVSEDRVILDEI
jgi:hypothetical protein